MRFGIIILLALKYVKSDEQAIRGKYRCDYEYFKTVDGWLKLHRVPADWQEAELRCHLEGGVLASPETTLMTGAMIKSMDNNQKTREVFTGIHSSFSKGDFSSIEGVPLSKIPHRWASGEPDNSDGNESCIKLLYDGTIGDVNCNKALPYICHHKSDKKPINECGTTDDGYKLDSRTGSCYKFHKDARIFSRAYMTCAAEGGYLAIINSEAEAEVIRQILKKHPASCLIGNFEKDVTFMGFHDWGEHGNWRTIHGQTLEAAGYSKFDRNQPNNVTAPQFCGSVHRNAALNDFWCDAIAIFICEKDPENLVTC